jgi:hypothetical protein
MGESPLDDQQGGSIPQPPWRKPWEDSWEYGKMGEGEAHSLYSA